MITKNAEANLYQLVYISERCKADGDQVINDIKLQAESNNHKLNITGALLFNERYFLQYIEGELNAINSLYNTICSDPRHSNVRLLLHKEIAERDFSRWSLGVKKLLDIEENQDLLSLLSMLGQANSVSETQLDWFKLALK
jgi:hypothetical protein